MASISIRWMWAAPLFRARAHTRTWNEYGSCRITGLIWLLSDYRKFVIFPCRYEFRIRIEGKQLSSEIFELLISLILTKLHVIYWYMYTEWTRFWLCCNLSCTMLLSSQGLTIIVFTEVAFPRSRATQCLGLYLGHLVSGVYKCRDLVLLGKGLTTSNCKTSHVTKPEGCDMRPRPGTGLLRHTPHHNIIVFVLPISYFVRQYKFIPS